MTSALNKVISTDPHCFLSIVGPSGSGKTRLIFELLTFPKIFHPSFDHIVYFYQHDQPLYTDIATSLKNNITFVCGVDWELIGRLPVDKNVKDKLEKIRYLLVFDDVCEDVAKNVQFNDLATSGRHRNLHVMFVKHNLYHQSKFSRTIDLNTTQIILFKSPRDQEQIRHLGRQLGNSKFLIAAYKDATRAAFGHLLIDLDPRCNEMLRFCTNITNKTIFYAWKRFDHRHVDSKRRKGDLLRRDEEENEPTVQSVNDECSKRIYTETFFNFQI